MSSIPTSIEVLERHLRSASEGRAKLSDYAAWLEQSGTSVPGRQTLYMDLRRYCRACDDLNYREYQKILEIDPHTGTDAIRYFLGEPWLASPLKPRLSSSVARCLLLAMQLKYEVEFPYAAVPEPGTPPSFKLWRGIPLGVLPGADSGYMAIWLAEGRVMHINLARILGRVAKTSQAGSHYRAPAPEQQVTLKVFAHDPYALDRCEMQFRGGRRIGAQELHFPLPASQAVMEGPYFGRGLSEAQYRLLTDPCPIRVCGAPTGSGKTYAFLKAAHLHQLVIFIVPTQALAQDVEDSAKEMSIPVARWDGMQGAALRQEGRSPWQERERQFEELAQSGGLLVTTPETLGAILIGKPQFHREHLDVASLLRAHHIVFDEAHTLTTRGFGFLHFWAVLIARRHLIYPEQTPKLTLLSATHSNLLEGLVGGDMPYIPKKLVACFDEKIKDGRGDGLRLLHGDVTVGVADADILSLVGCQAQEIINQEGRLLILYDRLRDLANEERALERIFNALGLKSEECFVITGQNKQSDGRALGGSDFEAGLCPETHHRIILATSSIEAGVNIEGLRYAIVDPGMDAAALLQRIGRVARKDVDGRIWISQPKDTPYHLSQLVELCGEVSVQAVYDHLKPLRIIHLKAARELGSAYWSMLARKQLALMKSIRREAHPALSEVKPPGAFLDSLHLMAKGLQEKGVRWREQQAFQKWLEAVDEELADLRGFAPMVRIQFADYPIIEYSRYWAESWLERPDDVDGDGVWQYYRDRTRYMRDKPGLVSMSLLRPCGGVVGRNFRPGRTMFIDAKEIYAQIAWKCAKNARAGREILEKAAKFIEATGLLITSKDTEPSPKDSMVA